MKTAINLKPFKDFLKSGQVGGLILILAVVLSLIIANSTLREGFENFLQLPLGFSIGDIHQEYSVGLWINDGLMAVFFLLVGLEIKREFLEGELSSVKRATLPIFAAVGGMLVPALLYTAFNYGTLTAHAWGIPMATDIAFALAIISILGKRVPTSLKVFLAALAIVDDLGAILVIAIFYTGEIHTDQLLYAGLIILLLAAFNYFRVRKLIFYIIPGLFLWNFIHHSGIHATISGVLLAFTIPANSVKKISPLEKLEHTLNIPVNYFIMPLFALANTNIHFEPQMLTGLSSTLGIGIICGLFFGKPAGILLFSFISVKLGLSSLPSRSKWKHILGLGMLGGIGFTMSVFIALLSFTNPEFHSEAKFAILTASLLSGLAGYFFLNSIYRKRVRKILAYKNCS